MQPSLAPGDLILTRRTTGISVGDIVVVDVGDAGKIIKRVSELDAETVVLAGDNSRLASSFCDYPHKRSTIVGEFLLHFSFFSRRYSLAMWAPDRGSCDKINNPRVTVSRNRHI